ncbi:MAG: YerC/YecD family TrpR-related protein [Microgenomates group bacterium]
MATTYPDIDMQNLLSAISTLKTKEELANFLRDLMTVKELADISQRWQIVLLLNQCVPYLEIAKQVGVSTTTVTRCALWLHHGKGGYKTALSRLHSTNRNV